MYTLGVNTTFPQGFPPELSTQSATAIISPFVLTIPANSSAIILVTFLPPTMDDTERIPIFSGYINIQSSNNESFYLSYMGVGCSMKDVIVTDFEERPPYISESFDDSAVPDPVGANETFYVATDPPNVNLRLVMGSPLVRLDILGNGNQIEVVGVNILGSAAGFPLYSVPRNDLTVDTSHYNATWNGTLSTGNQVPAGNYMFLYRALKLFGDQNNNADYENWTSPMFTISYDTFINNASNLTTSSPIINSSYSVKFSFFLIYHTFSFHIEKLLKRFAFTYQYSLALFFFVFILCIEYDSIRLTLYIAVYIKNY